MIGDVYVRASVPLKEVCLDPVTPQFVYDLLEELQDPEAARFFDALTKQAVTAPISLIKIFLGEDADLSGGVIGMPVLQPKYVYILYDMLLKHLLHNASICTIGAPKKLSVKAVSASFDEHSWWVSDAPSLPLNDGTLMRRSFAWILYHFAEYS